MPAAPYLTPAQIRARVPVLADTSKYPDDVLAELVAEFEQVAEDYRGVAFTPRTAVETQTIAPGSTVLILNHPRVRSVASVVVDGTTLSASTYRTTDVGLEFASGLSAGGGYATAAVVTTYDHGFDVPTPTVAPGAMLLRGCRLFVSFEAVADRSAVPRDIIATSADGITSRYSTPNKAEGRPTGYVVLDRQLNGLTDYRHPAVA